MKNKMKPSPDQKQSDEKSDLHKPEQLPTNKKPPPPSVQQQDTDYDVKPSIPKPTPKRTRVVKQFHASMPDVGLVLHATQMGESENQCNDDAYQFRTRILKSICSS